jgi:hypothetical protein
MLFWCPNVSQVSPGAPRGQGKGRGGRARRIRRAPSYATIKPKRPALTVIGNRVEDGLSPAKMFTATLSFAVMRRAPSDFGPRRAPKLRRSKPRPATDHSPHRRSRLGFRQVDDAQPSPAPRP